MASINGIKVQPVLSTIPEVSNESSSTIETLVEELQASRQLFLQQASQMEVLTTSLQSLTKEMRRLQK